MSARPVIVVCRGESCLREVLPRLGPDAERALLEGRVFIGARRARSAGEPVRAGIEVTLYPARRAPPGDAPRVLFEGEGVVALFKPAALATVADHHGAADSLEGWVARTLPRRAAWTATSRLDVGVSGVVLFATGSGALRHLGRARAEGRYLRHYVAIAERPPSPAAGVWDAPIGRDRDPRRRSAFGRDARPAATSFRTSAVTPHGALLAVEPITGRTHQIRVHAAAAGAPLLGDRAYGGVVRLVSSSGAVVALDRIALHAAWVEVPGLDGATIRVEAPVPDDLARLWAAAGGAPADWVAGWQEVAP